MISIKKILKKMLAAMVPKEAAGVSQAAISGADNARCRLIKSGKTVRAYISAGYLDGTTTIPTNTTLFTIPAGYRPKAEVVFPAFAWFKTGIGYAGNLRFYSDGAVKQKTSSYITSIYCAAEWETEET